MPSSGYKDLNCGFNCSFILHHMCYAVHTSIWNYNKKKFTRTLGFFLERSFAVFYYLPLFFFGKFTQIYKMKSLTYIFMIQSLGSLWISQQCPSFLEANVMAHLSAAGILYQCHYYILHIEMRCMFNLCSCFFCY